MENTEYLIDIDEDFEEAQKSVSVQNSVYSYLKSIAANPVLTKEEELELSRLIELGDSEARKKLIESNLKLVVCIAKMYQNHSKKHTLLDLIQEGNLGLIEACDRYDYRKDVRFSTYAVWWIKQYIIKSLTDFSRTVRIPSNVYKRMRKVKRVHDKLLLDTNTEPTPLEIAQIVGFPEKEVKELLFIVPEIISLDTKVGDKEDTTLENFIIDENSQGVTRTYDSFLRDDIDKALSCLSLKEETVIRKRFGLNTGKKETLEEVAKSMQISKERVRQHEKKALQKLKESSFGKHLKDYL